MQIATSRFSIISNSRSLALQCSNAVKRLSTHDFIILISNRVGLFTISQKYIFNVHQITTSGRKFNIVFWQRHRQKRTAQNAPKHVISSEKVFFSGEGHSLVVLLANVNSRSRSLYAIARPSVVCNVRAPYSAG